MTYPDSPQVVVGTRTLMIALTELEQAGWGGRLPEVAAGQPFWAWSDEWSDQAAELVAAGLAAYAPADTSQPRAEPPWTAHGTSGFARGTSNASH
jgi:hypothetical protein